MVDLTRILAGPFATMTLADLGADVVKVEHPEGGDDTRHWAPPYQGDQSAYFLSVNRNKRGIAVDLRTDAGRDIVQRLAAGADVLVENFRPGAAARLGLGYPELSRRSPGLVYASISGYGQTGPDAHLPGYDAIAQAVSGVVSITGENDRPPVRVGTPVADLAAALYAVVGILAALRARTVSGRGDWVDISLLDGQIAWLTYLAGGYFASGEVPRRYGSAHPTIVPYQALRTGDGYLMVAAGNDALWRRLADAVGRSDLGEDARFATNPDRVGNREALVQLLEEALSARSAAEWAADLNRSGIPAGAINTIDRALALPQVAARDMVVSVEHSTAGTLRMPGTPVRLTAPPAPVRRPPPLLGQHTDEVLAELGYDEAEVAAMRDAGAVA